MFWPWVILGAILLGAFVLELLSFAKDELSVAQALVVSAFYLVAGGACCVLFGVLYHYEWLGAVRRDTASEVLTHGWRTLAELLEGLLIGKLVLFENLFVVFLVFKSTGVRAARLRWPLMLAVVVMQVLRMAFVITQVLVVSFLSWAYYVLAVYLVIAAIHLLPEDGEEKTSFFVETVLAKLKARLVRVVPDERELGEGPTSRGGWAVVIVAVLIVDVVFAFNAAPVMLGVSPAPFVVIAATGLSLAGARAMYSLVAHLRDDLWPLRPYVAVVLILIAAQMLLGHVVKVPEPWPLVILAVVLAVGVWRTVLDHRARRAASEAVDQGS